MNIKFNPFLWGAGIATVLQILLVVINVVVSLAMTPTLDPTTFDPASQGFSSILGVSAIATFIGCCGGIFLDGLAGWIYAWRFKLEMGYDGIEVGDGALGGAVSAGAARVVSGLTSTIISIFTTPIMMERMGTADLQAELGGEFATFALVGGVVGGVVGICMYLVIGAIVGAVGGALGAAFFGREKTA